MRRGSVAVIVVLVGLMVAALVAIERADLSPGAKATAKRILITGAGLAIAVAFGAIAALGAPWWIAASVAGVALVGTGAYAIASRFLGLPAIKRDTGGGSSGCTPDRYGQTMPDGTVCLGI